MLTIIVIAETCSNTLLSGNKRACISAKVKVTMQITVAGQSLVVYVESDPF